MQITFKSVLFPDNEYLCVKYMERKNYQDRNKENIHITSTKQKFSGPIDISYLCIIHYDLSLLFVLLYVKNLPLFSAFVIKLVTHISWSIHFKVVITAKYTLGVSSTLCVKQICYNYEIFIC